MCADEGCDNGQFVDGVVGLEDGCEEGIEECCDDGSKDGRPEGYYIKYPTWGTKERIKIDNHRLKENTR